MPSPTAQPEQPRSSISLLTLAIASASSVVAAIVVSRVWGPGTLIGAAVTPVIVTLVSEALRKPAEVITVVRTTTGTEVRQPARPRRREVAAEELEAGDTVVAAPAGASRARRPALIAALATGLIAFAIGAFALTSTELVFGDAASGGGSTTYFSRGGDSGPSRAAPAQEEEAPTTSTETQTTTTTVPATPTPPPATEEDPAIVPPTGGTGASGATGATTP